ncbi:hypothetical protein TBLA_0C01860 [Henningerozyma blattae CBS 6284]|uniref:Serine/threonine-protein phosphatase 2A activator n=1 Tax=Henningerozyma blattae (strain ATCC 34711 / CBS 6284 / DSM 70876 / NBRC 10599 / NRRL Y-10934 / UCD 77-7) TaxID=1071380 RepID=I2H0U7_HENB6|nr:hypothetical protein TBLA_0C01860 [Tetrapisispora blattae CBS 6284]CCH59999.1 hypothetical protein TBLA_0C01860 [Tetrapisispora blattae CBS 6284]
MPEKRLLSSQDLTIWINSKTKQDLVDFIETLANSIVDYQNSQLSLPLSDSINNAFSLLQDIRDIIERYPVESDIESTKSRFGKVEFKSFYDDINQNSEKLIKSHFNGLDPNQIQELSIYLVESWGNRQRIDYGSGHELNFICFLYGLTKYNIFNLLEDSTNLVLKIFMEYINIMRIIETKYWLEPAGSHGVWGLDDYHFLPFLFGAFQLSKHKHLKPISIHNEEMVEMFKDKYMYFGCIDFINSIKTTATLRWHSPMLDDISGVKKWSKVSEGMIKMYSAEVLGKLPIMQHFYFSDFLPCPQGVSLPHIHGKDGNIEETHVHSTWGDCCGIQIPSAIAASVASKSSPKIHKPIPFD